MVITEVPSSPSLSTRWNMLSVGAGLEKSSYSLQYSQARLQRRIGIMCARRGCSVETRARTTSRTPRMLRESAFMRRRRMVWREGIVVFVYLITGLADGDILNIGRGNLRAEWGG